jgi:hypothetical protein
MSSVLVTDANKRTSYLPSDYHSQILKNSLGVSRVQLNSGYKNSRPGELYQLQLKQCSPKPFYFTLKLSCLSWYVIELGLAICYGLCGSRCKFLPLNFKLSFLLGSKDLLRTELLLQPSSWIRVVR